MFPTIYLGGGTDRITPDTFITIYVDGSSSMQSSYAAIASAVTTLLKPELLPYYNNDSGWYDSHVTVVQTDNSNDPGERGLRFLGYSGAAAPGGDNHVTIWISDEVTPYNAGSGDTFNADGSTARTATYNTDLATLRSYITGNADGYVKCGFIQVQYGSNDPMYKNFINVILAGLGNYSGTNGLSDLAGSFDVVNDILVDQTDDYYLVHITAILNAMGFVW
ncbi:MAG TPA: hypothetical protein PKV27_08140 [Ilumatobacteraceae bacterium]|nr:hypothetical protein [Ilumatobacteraceae bacterium]